MRSWTSPRRTPTLGGKLTYTFRGLAAYVHSHYRLTDVAQLPALLRQAVVDLADPTITYLLGGHYYDRTAHPRYRHFPAVFTLRQGEVWNVEVGPDFVAFDTEFIDYPEPGEPHYPGPWADRFRATVLFTQLY